MLYVVHIEVENDVHEAWYLWMRSQHIHDVLETRCFRDAIMVRDPDADTEHRTAYRVLYRAFSERSFHRYQREHAEALKADHADRFAGKVVASRELLPVTGFFEAASAGDE